MGKSEMPETLPPQHQERQPGIEAEMDPQPVYDNDDPGYGRLEGKVALITGGDSGIGRSVAIMFAKEGADVAIAYLDEHEDAEETARLIRNYGKEPLLIAADVSDEANCRRIVDEVLQQFDHLDILVNNAAIQFEQQNIEDISVEQWDKTFKTNIHAYFYMCKYAVPHMKEGASIINTSSVTAYKGKEILMDYASTKGAIVSFTRSLSQSLAERKIRVNAVAPGPVWTPLIPASFSEEEVAEFGQSVPLGRPAQPVEIAPSYVFLASKDGSYFTGQVLHPNGGTIVNS